MSQTYDVIIVGAGIAGSSLALGLAKQGYEVALIDQRCLCEYLPDTIDLRTSAINHATQRLFEQLDVWEIISKRVSVYEHMTVWDENGKIHFDCSETASSALGYIIENSVMQCALHQLIRQNAHIHYIQSTPLALYLFSDSPRLILTDKRMVIAKLLVGADGAQSWVREAAGLETVQRSYEQTAIIATIHTEKSHERTAWQHFTKHGPVAFLPLSDDHLCSIVWSQTHAIAESLMAASPECFVTKLEEAFGNRLGRLSLASERKAFPLMMRHAQSYHRDHVMLVADALHTIHPLAGLGLNLGLKDVQALLKLTENKKALGSFAQLSAYQQARKCDNFSVLWAMRGLKSLFSNDNAVLAWFRNQGLNVFDRLPSIKNSIIQQVNSDTSAKRSKALPN